MLMIALALSVGLNLAIAGRWWLKHSSDHRPYKRIHDLVLVLYVVRRRLQVVLLKLEIRWEVAVLRRKLKIELARLRRWEESVAHFLGNGRSGS
jgi:hypothetical protein